MNRLTAITLFVSFMGMALGAILHSRGICCLSLGFLLGQMLARMNDAVKDDFCRITSQPL